MIDFDAQAQVKRAVVRLETKGGVVGTGYLVAKDRIATCHHVVKDVAENEAVVCSFDELGVTRQGFIASRDEATDAGLLRFDEATAAAPLELLLDEVPPTFWIHGYPYFTDKIPVSLEGRLTDPDTIAPGGIRAFALFSPQFAGRTPDSIGGFSGSPVLSGRRVVGHMSSVLGSREARKAPNFGYGFAVRALGVHKLLGGTAPEPAAASGTTPDRALDVTDVFYEIDLATTADGIAQALAHGSDRVTEQTRLFAAERLIEVGASAQALPLLAELPRAPRRIQLEALATSLLGNRAAALALLDSLPGAAKSREWLDAAERRLVKPAATAPTSSSPAPAPASIWNIPFPKNPNFTGRSDVLTTVRKQLTDGARFAIVTGLPGVGKTQVALEYVYRHRGDYSCCWWLRAEDPSVFVGDFAALGTEAKLPATTDQKAAVAAVREWLQHKDNWLLVLDFASDAAIARDYVPTGGNGHVLITSRDHRWRELGQPLVIEALTRGEAIALLLVRSGTTDQAAAGKVADALGCLPLALVQAAAYVEDNGTTFEDYLAAYAKQCENLLATTAPSDHQSVASTFRVALTALCEKSPAAVGLVQTCAFLDPEAIPLSLFRDQADQFGDELGKALADPAQFQAAVAAAMHLALIERAGETITCHRMVQTVARDDLAPTVRQELCTGIVNLMAHVFTFDDKNLATWPAAQAMAPHVLAVTGHAEALGVSLALAGALLQRVGSLDLCRGLFVQARAVLERSVDLLVKANGEEHIDVATARHDLGRVLQIQGDLAGARQQLDRALAVVEKLKGPEDSETGAMLQARGGLALQEGDPAAARADLERALAIQEKVHGSTDDAGLVNANHELGRALLAVGDLPGAREHFERALEMQRRLWGEDHPETAATLQMISATLLAQGDLTGARERAERALAIVQQKLGDEHLDVAHALEQLAAVKRAQGDLVGARETYERALAVKRKALGTNDHAEVAVSLQSIADILISQGDLANARAKLEEALAILRRLPSGGDPLALAATLLSLGKVLRELGDVAAARPLVEESVATMRKLYGDDNHADVALALHELGVLACASQDFATAKSNLEQSLAILRKTLGTDENPLIAASLHELATVCYAQKDFAGATAHIENALAIKRKLLGEEHPDTLPSLQVHAAILFSKGDHAGARAEFERLLAIETKLEGSRDHWGIALTEESLATVLRADGDAAGAKTLLEHAYGICKAQLGPEHEHTKRMAKALAT